MTEREGPIRVEVSFDMVNVGNLKLESPELQRSNQLKQFWAAMQVFVDQYTEAMPLSREGILIVADRMNHHLYRAFADQGWEREIKVVPVWEQPSTTYTRVDARTGEPL